MLSKKFRIVIFVPGNHDLWVIRNKEINSYECFKSIRRIANEYGIFTEPINLTSISIIPLFGWYDYSFGKPSPDLYCQWADFKSCLWPLNMNENDITKYFLSMNNDFLKITNTNVITFSHFMPRIDIIPDFIPSDKRTLYPVFGTVLLEEQIRILKPKIHIYGHIHFNIKKNIDAITYINNAFGYPYETRITSKELNCIYEI